MYNIVKKLTDTRVLIRNQEGDSLVASYSDAFVKYGDRPEVLIFKSDAKGTITDWLAVYGEKHSNDSPVFDAITDTIDTFNKVGEDGYWENER